ncbi:hypothetical protein ABH940_004830 [Streptacidiphilus sp. BW17]|uniref:DUF4236 domain-containing protein n=1 Tax=Streptacidiphilus sp. BW17 TaxID=3156274 RepID=UPI0035129E34
MGFSNRKSFKTGPFRVTASKSGMSYSAGVKGMRVTKRANGRVQTTLSTPGTGLRYTSTNGKRTTRRTAKRVVAVAPNTLIGITSTTPTPPPAGTRPLVFKGYLATVTLHPDRIEIARTFAGRMNGNRSGTIPWHQVVAADFRDPTITKNGYIHFVVSGDPRGLTSGGNGNRLAATARQPHALMFTWQQRETYRQLKGMLEASAALRLQVMVDRASVASEVANLDDLLRRGILTPQEYTAARERLLGR